MTVRFSNRSVLIVAVAVACGTNLLLVRWRRHAALEHFVRIELQGAISFRRDDPFMEPSLLRRWLQPWREVDEVLLSDCEVTSHDVHTLVGFHVGFRSIDLTCTKIDEGALESLALVPTLERVRLSTSQVSDAAIASFRERRPDVQVVVDSSICSWHLLEDAVNEDVWRHPKKTMR